MSKDVLALVDQWALVIGSSCQPKRACTMPPMLQAARGDRGVEVALALPLELEVLEVGAQTVAGRPAPSAASNEDTGVPSTVGSAMGTSTGAGCDRVGRRDADTACSVD